MLYLSFVGRILRVDFSWLWNWRTWLYCVVGSKSSFGSDVLEQAGIGSRCECELQFRHVSAWQKNDLPVGWLFAAGRERLGYRLRWSALNGNSHHRGPLHCIRNCKLS